MGTSRIIRGIVWTLICTFFFGLLMSLAGVVCADELKPVPDTIGQKTVGPQKPEPAPAPQPAQIIFPTIPVLDQDQVPAEEFLPSPPVPKPPQRPKFVSELSEETWLVIESPESIVVTSSPLGHVNIQPEEGPVKVRGKFADGTGKIETRTFTSKYLYFINAVKQGKVEILVFNPGIVTEEKDIPRFPLTVMGLQPNPPPGPGPKPDPNPKPDPDPPPVPTSDHLLIEVVEDPLNRAPDTAIVLSALAEWNDLKDKGHDWRIYSIRTTEPLGVEAVKESKDVPPPAVVIRDKSTRKVLRVINLPKTMADLKRVLSELTGGVL